MQNGLIDLDESESVKFCDAYMEWFKGRLKINRPQTMDRIEVTWNRYFAHSAFIDKCTSKISEKDIIDFITTAVISGGSVSHKELERILQILRNTLSYVRDMGCVGSRLYDWDAVKRNIPTNYIVSQSKNESALSRETVRIILHKVIHEDIYPEKRSACLLLCLNFFLGLRVGELAALRFEDFDTVNRVVNITRSDSKSFERDESGNRLAMHYDTRETKTTYSVRTLPLMVESVYIYELIRKHHSACGYESPYLCYDGADTIRVRSLDRTLRRLCVLCDVTHFNTHLIRKTFASMLHHANVPTRAISDLRGHSEISTTERSYNLSFDGKMETYYGYMKDGLNYN